MHARSVIMESCSESLLCISGDLTMSFYTLGGVLSFCPYHRMSLGILSFSSTPLSSFLSLTSHLSPSAIIPKPTAENSLPLSRLQVMLKDSPSRNLTGQLKHCKESATLILQYSMMYNNNSRVLSISYRPELY